MRRYVLVLLAASIAWTTPTFAQSGDATNPSVGPSVSFKYKGESQAEFEERERRCLATAIYFVCSGTEALHSRAVDRC
jgi:hypothetical protein